MATRAVFPNIHDFSDVQMSVLNNDTVVPVTITADGKLQVNSTADTLDIAFFTNTPLDANDTYTSSVYTFEDNSITQVQSEIKADQDGTAVFTFYSDLAGTLPLNVMSMSYVASDGYRQCSTPTSGLSGKWSFTNGSTPQTSFFFATKVLRQAVSPQITNLDAYITGTMVATINRSVIMGSTEGGRVYKNVSVDDEGHLEVRISRPTTAFGDLSVAEKTPISQVDFVHGINPLTTLTWNINSAPSASASAARGSIESGTNAAGHATVSARRAARYRPGQGLDAEFTAAFLAGGVASSEQYAGIINAEAGIAFGYDGTSYGILHRTGGLIDVRTLTVSAGAGGSENATITLDGSTKVVALVVGSASVTASQLAQANYETTGRGWYSFAVGSTVVFTSITGGASGAGAFTLTSTGTAAGTFATTRAGVAPTDDWTPQASFNTDILTGIGGLTNPSKILIDPKKLNVYKIQEQFLGAGGIDCYVENSVNKQYTLAHRFNFANSRTAVTLTAPTSRVLWSSRNTGATTSQQIVMGSGAAFVEGKIVRLGPVQTARFYTATIGVTFRPVISIRMPTAWNNGSESFTNWCEAFMQSLCVSTGGSSQDVAEFILVRDATLAGAVWSYKDQAVSPVLVDTTATTYTNGREVTSISCPATGQAIINLQELAIVLARGESLTVVARSVQANTDVYAALNWVVDV